MLIIYIDDDIKSQAKLFERFKRSHKVVTFSELLDAYKWIRRNQIPDLIIAEVDIESPTGLQTLKFLESRKKLKATYKISYSKHLSGNQRDLILFEGASEVFEKRSLLSDLSLYIKFIHDGGGGNKVGKPLILKRGKGNRHHFQKPE